MTVTDHRPEKLAPDVERRQGSFGGANEQRLEALHDLRDSLAQQHKRVFEKLLVQAKDQAVVQEQSQRLPDESVRLELLAQVQEEVDRGLKLLSLLGQQLNVIGAEIYNLEVLRLGQFELPTTQQLTVHAAEAQKIMAALQAADKIADSITGPYQMSPKERAVFEELERESASAIEAEKPAPVEKTVAAEKKPAEKQKPEPQREQQASTPTRESRRSEAEPG